MSAALSRVCKHALNVDNNMAASTERLCMLVGWVWRVQKLQGGASSGARMPQPRNHRCRLKRSTGVVYNLLAAVVMLLVPLMEPQHHLVLVSLTGPV